MKSIFSLFILLPLNSKVILNLLIGFQVGFSSLILNIFSESYNTVCLLKNLQVQVETSLDYLYPLIFFLKKHSLTLFRTLIDLICYEVLNNKYILIYSLLNIENSQRMLIKIKVQEFNRNLLSITSLFSSA